MMKRTDRKLNKQRKMTSRWWKERLNIDENTREFKNKNIS